MEQIINSKYYTLKEAYSFNQFIKKCSSDDDVKPEHNERYHIPSISKMLFEAWKVKEPYRRLSDFVPNSYTWMEIKDEENKYDEAQMQLKMYNHTSEMILDEIYPKGIQIWKHTYEEKRFDERDDSEYTVKYNFYSDLNDIITGRKWNEIMLDYIRGDVDLIEESIQILDTLHLQNRICRLAEELSTNSLNRITYDELCHTFNMFKFGFFIKGIDSIIKYDDVEYSNDELIQFVEGYRRASKRCYIYKDEYVDYPRCCFYMDFKKSLDDGLYVDKELSELPF